MVAQYELSQFHAEHVALPALAGTGYDELTKLVQERLAIAKETAPEERIPLDMDASDVEVIVDLAKHRIIGPYSQSSANLGIDASMRLSAARGLVHEFETERDLSNSLLKRLGRLGRPVQP